MRIKLKVYLSIFVIFVAGTSGILFWNSSSYLDTFSAIESEREIHESYHHLLMDMRTSLLELYRYESDYSHDLDALISSMEEAEKEIHAILGRGLPEELKALTGEIENDFNAYMDAFSLSITGGQRDVKAQAMKKSISLGNSIAKKLVKAEDLSWGRMVEMKALNLARIERAQYFVSITVLFVLLLAAAVYLHIRYTVTRPFIRFIRFVEKISGEPNLSLRAEIPTDSDLALLARRFNDMMDNLERWDEELKCNYEELKSSNEELQASYINMEELTTELEEKSQELFDAGEELKSIDRLKNEFMQNVSHELRTPLTPVAGYLELFLNKDLGNLSPTQMEIMTDMHQCCKRLAFIIDSLLEMVSLQEDYPTEKFELFDVSDVVKEIGGLAAVEAEEKGLSLKIDCPDNLPSINGAKKKVVLMLNHILKNAVKFTHDGGTVTFAAKTTDDGVVEFTIEDSGIGIKEEKIAKIFEPFLQLDSSLTRGYEGVGLGLALVKKVAEIHRGKITVSSKEGEGTTVVVSLPSA